MLYRGDVDRLRGDVKAALARYEQAAAMTAPGRHQVWPPAAERRVGALRQLGRLEESIALGRETVRFAEEEDLEPVNRLRFWVALALSEAQAGALDEARRHISAAMSCARSEGIGGVAMGIVHESEARIAILARDPDAFTEAAQACATYLLGGDNPALTAKYDRLWQDARTAGLVQIMAQRSMSTQETSAQDALRGRLQTLPEAERTSAILDVLLRGCHADAGCLFLVTKHGARPIAGDSDSIGGGSLQAAVDAFLTAELTDTDVVTLTQHDEHAAERPIHNWAQPGEAPCIPMLIRATRQDETLVCGVAVLRLKGDEPSAMDQHILDVLGETLMAADENAGRPQAQ